MIIKPKEEKSQGLSYFEKGKPDRKLFALLLAAYNNRTKNAEAIIEKDPAQINRQDPHSGLTALHIAIFRQNSELVDLIANHPDADLQIKDNFNRKAVDMLDYTSNQDIFNAVMDATYPDLMSELEEFAESDDELPEVENFENKKVIPLKPKEP